MQLIFVYLGLAAFMTLGSSLECYQCKDCQPNFIDKFTGGGDVCTNRPIVEERCVKEIDRYGTVNRRCGTTIDCAFKEAFVKCQGESVVPCVICCDTDDCNEATVLHSSVFVVGLLAALLKCLF